MWGMSLNCSVHAYIQVQRQKFRYYVVSFFFDISLNIIFILKYNIILKKVYYGINFFIINLIFTILTLKRKNKLINDFFKYLL
jgi:hypothetical protein